MRKRNLLFINLIGILILSCATTKPVREPHPVENIIKWHGQSSILLTGEKGTVYIDPLNVRKSEIKADLILITHPHKDHFSLRDINKIIDSETIIVGPKDVISGLPKSISNQKEVVIPGEGYNFAGFDLVTVKAYNTTKSYHEEKMGWVGYVITFEGIKIYHAGDTQRIPEMVDLDCDVMLTPLGQTYTMNSVTEAVNAVLDTKASIAIPFHYGMYEGTEINAKTFVSKLEGKVEAIILEKQ